MLFLYIALVVAVVLLLMSPRLLRAYRRRSRIVIGVGIELASWRGIVPSAWIFAAIDPKGPAGRAGIKLGDFLLKVDGQPIFGVPRWELRRRMSRRLGAAILLTVRSGETVCTHALHFERVHFPLPEVKLDSQFAVASDGVSYHPRMTSGMTVSLKEKILYPSRRLTDDAIDRSL